MAMFKPLFIVLSLTAAAVACNGATVVMTSACWIVICSIPCAGVVVSGLTTAPLCAACLSSCFCFDEPTNVTTRSGQTDIGSVAVGEDVLTLDEGGAAFWTPVEQKTVVRGDFSFAHIRFSARHDAAGDVTASGWQSELLVTANHPMLVLEAGSQTIRPAATLLPGDLVRASEGATAQIADVKFVRRSRKVALVTQDCTVLANGVHSAASCERPDRSATLLALTAMDDRPLPVEALQGDSVAPENSDLIAALERRI